MQPRNCPLCGAADAETLAELEAAEFCATNLTYIRDFRPILGIADRAVFPLRRCTRCGFVYAGLLPSEAFLTTLYESVIRADDCIDAAEQRTKYAERLRTIAELVQLAPPGRALDFGSGAGVALRILRACNIDAIGFDPSATRRDYARDLPVFADMSAIESRAPFAIFILDNVLEHLPHPVATIEHLARLAAPGAVAYVSVPAYERAFLERQLDAHRRGAPLDMTLNPWEHLNYFDAAHLEQLMSRGGFTRIAASSLASTPDVGVRAERSRTARVKNAAASAVRLAKYALRGDVAATAQHGFYRRA